MTMKAKFVTLTPQNVDTDGICAAQTTAGAANMLINGALASGGTVTLSVASQLGVYCAADINTIIFVKLTPKLINIEWLSISQAI